jgi:hypothetical protein
MVSIADLLDSRGLECLTVFSVGVCVSQRVEIGIDRSKPLDIDDMRPAFI